jgi:diguanylate cyclase (GGDEF)-like protein/PAS domain S-box-containing protein
VNFAAVLEKDAPAWAHPLAPAPVSRVGSDLPGNEANHGSSTMTSTVAVNQFEAVPLAQFAPRFPQLNAWLPLALSLWIGICLLWIPLRWGGQTAQALFGIFYDLPIGPAIVWLCWSAAADARLPARVRRGWTFLGASYFTYWLGNCTWNVFEGILGVDPFPSIADFFFLALYPPAIYGLTCLTGRLATRAERVKFGLDCATATVCALGLLWYFVLRHVELDTGHGALGIIVSAAYPIADVLLLVALISAMLKRKTTTYVLPLAVLAAAYVSMMVGDLLFLVPALEDQYASGGLADVFFLLGFGLAGWAARLQVVTVAPQPNATSRRSATYSTNLLPYLAIAGVYAVLIWSISGEWRHPHAALTLVALATTALVVARQVLAHRENAQLSAAHAAHAAEARYSSLVKHSSDVVLVIDERGIIGFVTPSVEQLLHLKPEALIGQPLSILAHPQDAFHLRHFCRDLTEDPSLTGPVEWRLRTGDDGWRYVEIIGSNLIADPTVCGLVLNARDVTERKKLEEQLKHLAFTDSLTLLANRHLFNEQVALALARAETAGGGPALIFIDLDNFKAINDSLGHETGDKLLTIAARRLLRSTHSDDTVARLGGDEFAVLIPASRSDEELRQLATRLLETVEIPYAIDGRHLTVSASLGLARAEPGTTPQELLRNADLAMYRAKSRGKRCYEVFEPAIYAELMESVDLEVELGRAIDDGELVPHFQPIVDLRSGVIVGAEVLARWQHPQRGLIAPKSFIPIAENCGLIAKLGRTMFAETCRTAAGWLAAGNPRSLQHLAVNLSGRQLEHPDLVADVERSLHEHRIPPQRVVLELTETVLMQNVTTAIERLNELKRIGVRIALDDFGTGYSSLSYLHRFPIDILKIDRSFIGDLRNSDGSALVRTIIALAQTLNLDVIAEGIERTDQLVRARRFGCRLGQGFYFSAAASGGAFSDLLRSPRRLAGLTVVST